jgi:hypothetical protein
MDFGFTAENNAFREEVRQFIADHITPEVQAELKQSRLKGPGPLTKRKRSQGEVGNEGEEISRARRDQVDIMTSHTIGRPL